MQAIGITYPPETATGGNSGAVVEAPSVEAKELVDTPGRSKGDRPDVSRERLNQRVTRGRQLEILLEQARYEDKAHRAAHQKPISADMLRVRLGIGATSARRLVKIVRAEFEASGAPDRGDEQHTREVRNADAALSA